MKVELSKKEIEAILEIMEAGKTFLITHTSYLFSLNPHRTEDPNEERVNVDELMERLRKRIESKIRLFKCPECGAMYKGTKKMTGGRCMVPNCNSILEEIGERGR